MSDQLRPLGGALREAAALLGESGIATARADAELLAAYYLGREQGREVSRGEVAALAVMGTATEPEGFRGGVELRAQRIPLQHLTGQAPFRRLTLEVGPGVFVPRPETEVLVDVLNEYLAERVEGSAPIVVDLATGSGALALAAAVENPTAQVTGVELSDQALAWAQRNAETVKREYGRTVRIIQGDARTALDGWENTVTAVMTNPPYIPESMVPCDPEVAEHDPPLALYGGSVDGLRIPQEFIVRAAQLLTPGGLLVLEHAEVQADAIAEIFRRHGFDHVSGVRDLTGRSRATKGYAGIRA